MQPIQKPTPDFDKEVLAPLQQAQADAAAKAAREAAAEQLAAEQAQVAQSAPVVVVEAAPSDSLIGSIGRATWGGNCVDEPGVNNPGWGNPIDWPVISRAPWIGATVLFYFNHTGVVTGIWPNGDLEIRHQNFHGEQHRFPRSAFRGFR